MEGSVADMMACRLELCWDLWMVLSSAPLTAAVMAVREVDKMAEKMADTRAAQMADSMAV